MEDLLGIELAEDLGIVALDVFGGRDAVKPLAWVQLTWGSHLSSTKFQGIESLHRLGSKVESGGIMQRPWPHQLTSGRINIRTHIPHA